MVIKNIRTFSRKTATFVIVQTLSKTISFTAVGFIPAEVAYEVVDNICAVACYVGSNFPFFSISSQKRFTLLYITVPAELTTFAIAFEKSGSKSFMDIFRGRK